MNPSGMHLDAQMVRTIFLVFLVFVIFATRMTKGTAKETPEGLTFSMKPAVTLVRYLFLPIYLAVLFYPVYTHQRNMPVLGPRRPPRPGPRLPPLPDARHHRPHLHRHRPALLAHPPTRPSSTPKSWPSSPPPRRPHPRPRRQPHHHHPLHKPRRLRPLPHRTSPTHQQNPNLNPPPQIPYDRTTTNPGAPCRTASRLSWGYSPSYELVILRRRRRTRCCLCVAGCPIACPERVEGSRFLRHGMDQHQTGCPIHAVSSHDWASFAEAIDLSPLPAPTARVPHSSRSYPALIPVPVFAFAFLLVPCALLFTLRVRRCSASLTNPQYSRTFPRSPNYFSRFYSAKSHVNPPNPQKPA